ncbi:hypothetical protein PHYSODRAFT_328628 [Phytophthora sojae]|uniref:RxLR effector protein n=1 Tax=Phytophthora sojae (strain P6497) TaxID=1094619 RepID=G4Z9X0_PHYSP|nr:hypothetical protein PHYSODRAFT_328628 [Phytophthora sojae]EGZ20519.1 hypothetical protein PHYSODRAFT_328628 [Phytophthora sojae]|eukprot:XP_009523236.1 hypothetical protein PHYSODRAFT_328628 [Phytophthora sojae]
MFKAPRQARCVNCEPKWGMVSHTQDQISSPGDSSAETTTTTTTTMMMTIAARLHQLGDRSFAESCKRSQPPSPSNSIECDKLFSVLLRFVCILIPQFSRIGACLLTAMHYLLLALATVALVVASTVVLASSMSTKSSTTRASDQAHEATAVTPMEEDANAFERSLRHHKHDDDDDDDDD